MLYAIIRDENGEVYSKEFWSAKEYRDVVWGDPSITEIFFCDTSSTHMVGKTYEEKKEFAREDAIAWQSAIGEFSPSYEDFAIAGDYFSALGKKYGLLREFRENGIC